MFFHRNYPSPLSCWRGPSFTRSAFYLGTFTLLKASLQSVSAFPKSVASCRLTALFWDYQCMVRLNPLGGLRLQFFGCKSSANPEENPWTVFQNQGFKLPGRIQTMWACDSHVRRKTCYCSSSEISEIMGCDKYLYALFSGCFPDSVGKRMLPEINCFEGN